MTTSESDALKRLAIHDANCGTVYAHSEDECTPRARRSDAAARNVDVYVIAPHMLKGLVQPFQSLEDAAKATALAQHAKVFGDTDIIDVAIWQVNSRNITVRFTWKPRR